MSADCRNGFAVPAHEHPRDCILLCGLRCGADVVGDTHRRPRWQSMLLFGRVSNLPTVWSNCPGGVVARGGTGGGLPGARRWGHRLYAGGMFLNDAFDEEFDRANAGSARPRGRSRRPQVWRWGWIGGLPAW